MFSSINLVYKVYAYTSTSPAETPLALVNTPAETSSELLLQIPNENEIYTGQ